MDAADQCDAVADRLADDDAAEEAAELRGQEAAAQHRAALLQALVTPADATLDVSELADAIDEGLQHDGGPVPMALIDAARGCPGALLRWIETVAFARAADQHGKRVEREALAGVGL